MGIDWSDGDYSRTARQLEPISQRVVRQLGVSAGQRVLDIGCGTGNAALAATGAGARVRGVDPAAGLLEIAERRAAEQRLEITFLPGDVEELRTAGDFDVVLSVFGVIFQTTPPPQLGR